MRFHGRHAASKAGEPTSRLPVLVVAGFVACVVLLIVAVML